MGISVLAAFLGIGVGYYFYAVNTELPDKLVKQFNTAYTWLLNKYYVDEFYLKYVVGGIMKLKDILAKFDLSIIDGAVNGAAKLGKKLSEFDGAFDRVVVDGAVNAVGDGIVTAGGILRKMQTGLVQNYLIVAIIGMAILLSIVLL
ncbi:MAG: hypothetical protein ACP5T7_01905 [bacterium]